MRGMLLDMLKTNIDMKKLFATIGFILSFSLFFGQGNEGLQTEIIYENTFNNYWDSFGTGELVEWDSTTIHNSYDGSPVCGIDSVECSINLIAFHNGIESATFNFRLKKSPGTTGDIVIEYGKLSEGYVHHVLYEGQPDFYYHSFSYYFDGLLNCEKIQIFFRVEGEGSYYLDDFIVTTTDLTSSPISPIEEDYQSEDEVGCLFDSNGDGNINHTDLLDFLSVYGSICE